MNRRTRYQSQAISLTSFSVFYTVFLYLYSKHVHSQVNNRTPPKRDAEHVIILPRGAFDGNYHFLNNNLSVLSLILLLQRSDSTPVLS